MRHKTTAVAVVLLFLMVAVCAVACKDEGDGNTPAWHSSGEVVVDVVPCDVHRKPVPCGERSPATGRAGYGYTYVRGDLATPARLVQVNQDGSWKLRVPENAVR